MNVIKLITEQQYDNHPPGYVIGRQGDVVLYKPHTPPVAGDSVKQTNNRVVIALGESTGHAHVLVDDANEMPLDSRAYSLHETDPDKYAFLDQPLPGYFLSLHERALLKHDEHPLQSYPARDYVVVIQHEGDELGELHKIAD